jgi:drug/metabolite transporter (DMT)-like permease
MAIAVVISAALHAAWNLLARRYGRPREMTMLFLAGSVSLSLPLALALTRASWLRAVPWGVTAGLAEAAYFFTLAHALEIGPLGPVYTISRGGSMLLVWPVSYWILGEVIEPRTLIAVAVLLVALALLSPRGEYRGATSKLGYLWALGCGLCIAGVQIAYKEAVINGGEPLQIFAVSMSTALLCLILSSPRPLQSLPRIARAQFGVVAFGSLAMTMSFVIVLYVFRHQGAGWVMTLRNSSIGFAQLLGWLVLGERPGIRATAGMVLAFAGALLIGSA